MLSDLDAHTTLPATDLQRARDFYEGKLGFTPDQVAPGGVFYRSGQTRFLVFPSRGTSSGSHTQIGWVVDDIEAMVAELRSRGVQLIDYDLPNFKTVNSIFDAGELKSAWFNDTEGNLLGIVQLSS